MTINEISKLLGYNHRTVYDVFEQAKKHESKIGIDIKNKLNMTKRNKSVDWSFEEADFAMSFLPTYTKMSSQYLKENFIKRNNDFLFRPTEKTKLSYDEKLFLYRYLAWHKQVYCCNTCHYIRARRENKAGSKFHPYCEFYTVFLNKALPKRNVYKDSCPSYKFSTKEPFMWNAYGPQNINIYLKNNNRTLGIDNSEFTSEKSDNNVIILLNEHHSEVD